MYYNFHDTFNLSRKRFDEYKYQRTGFYLGLALYKNYAFKSNRRIIHGAFGKFHFFRERSYITNKSFQSNLISIFPNNRFRLKRILKRKLTYIQRMY